MKAKQNFKIIPNIPNELSALKDLAYNTIFSWQPKIRDIFKRIDSQLWSQTGHNPVKLINLVSQDRLNKLVTDKTFISELQQIQKALSNYTNIQHDYSKKCIAYLSAEFGITTCLPIYSGGLGILAGDHLKSASDLNLPLVAVGLLYQEGYFKQYLNSDGWQQESYPLNEFINMSVQHVNNADGSPLKVYVNFKEQSVAISVWKVNVGRIPLYLLDTNLQENPEYIRKTTSQLYGGDRETRLRQEIVLGIGGIRALKALNIYPTVVHMNEGHSVFSALERINLLRKDYNLSFDEAREIVQASTVFTTHTPVPAGNDTFDPELVRAYFEEYSKELGINWLTLLAYGRIYPRDDHEAFGVTPLALRLSSYSNGVSKLHGSVSRNMWKDIWPKNPTEDIPITSITNGIHIPSWLSREMTNIFDRYLGPTWHLETALEQIWNNIEQIPLTELWRAHSRSRERLVTYTRKHLIEQLRKQGTNSLNIQKAMEVLNPDYLTIGFARRFATYKRANLLFDDLNRLDKILNNSDKPIQIIIAGKAHPQDNEGKSFIKQIIHIARDERFCNKVVFLENYNIHMANILIAGTDVWLNNPRRPMEACGTSGMKALANGNLNLSVLDGWWDEGYGTKYGWAIGDKEYYDNYALQDKTESKALYNLLEEQVAPLYYERNKENVPIAWCKMMRNAIRDLVPVFNSHRMVSDYDEKFYNISSERYINLRDNNFAEAKEQAKWRQQLLTSWNEIQILEITTFSQEPTKVINDLLEVTAKVKLAKLKPIDVTVELYYGPTNHDNDFISRNTLTLTTDEEIYPGEWLYKGTLKCETTGNFGYTVRITPCKKKLGNPFEMGLITWA